MPNDVIPLRAPRADIESLVEQIKVAVYEFAGRVSIAEVVGALEIAKHDILRNEHD